MLTPRESLCSSAMGIFLGWFCILASLNLEGFISPVLSTNILFFARFILGIAGGISTLECPGFLLRSDYRVISIANLN